MRASDHARERTAGLLRRRCDEGYLSLDTYERRLERTFRARDIEELARLSADLPAVGVLARLRQWLSHRSPSPPAEVRLPLELIGTRPLVLGRGPRCHVMLGDDTVSRIHAEIRREGDGWSVRDLGSSNGTWVGGVRITSEHVAPGDELVLGGCRVRLL